ncbi:MAG: hypothetical protein HQM13_12240 [SAR324 cluster bacterium]|nr:hypothetical protein [SAR324 cluster bacterium]
MNQNQTKSPEGNPKEPHAPQAAPEREKLIEKIRAHEQTIRSIREESAGLRTARATLEKSAKRAISQAVLEKTGISLNKREALEINIMSALEYSEGNFYPGNQTPMNFAEDLIKTLEIDPALKKMSQASPRLQGTLGLRFRTPLCKKYSAG